MNKTVEGLGGAGGADRLAAAVEWERSLFHPLQVDPGMLRWMASERQKINAALPGVKPVIATLKGLADAEFSELITGASLPDVEPVKLEAGGLAMYRTLRENQPRFPVYVISDRGLMDRLVKAHDVAPDGKANELDLSTRVYDPGRTKIKTLWSLLGQIHGVRRPILGFIRGDKAEGAVQVIEPKTITLERYLLGLVRSGSFDEKRQAEEGRKLAELELKTAGCRIRPRGACDPANICVREDGQLFYGSVYFQVTNMPQESMSFMLSEHSHSLFPTLGQLDLAPPPLIRAYLDKINEAGMLDFGVFSEMRANQATAHRYLKIPRAFRDYIEQTIGRDVPPLM